MVGLGAALPGASALVAGCDAAGPEPAFTVTDSAGVRIAESRAPAWEAGDGWRLASEPALEIGVAEGADEYEFSNIVTAWRQPHGRLVVGDRGASDGMIRFYDTRGRFLQSVGNRGDGPGEFQMIFALGPYRGDSIVAWDVFLSRLTVFDGQGRLGRTRTLELPVDDNSTPGGGMALMEQGAVLGFFGDGSVLVFPSRVVSRGGEPVRWERRYFRYSPDGEPLDTIGPLPRPEPGPAPTPAARRLPRPFRAPMLRAINEDRLYVGAGARYELEVRIPEGALERVIRVVGRDLTLTEEDREAYRRVQREGAADDEALRSVEQGLRELEFPSTRPAYSGALHVDGVGHLWVQHFRMPGEMGAIRWDVFDPRGRLLGVIETPERLRIHQIERDLVVGTWVGEMDVPYVRMYRLERR